MRADIRRLLGKAAQEANARITAILQAIALEALYTRGDEGSQTCS